MTKSIRGSKFSYFQLTRIGLYRSTALLAAATSTAAYSQEQSLQQPISAFNQTSQAVQSEGEPSGTTDQAPGNGEITVTGSRIQKTGYDQPTPVTVQTQEALLSSAPTSLADALNRLPQLAGSVTRTFCCAFGSNGNFLNLRGLGTGRNLVLLDGRRIVPTRESGDTDVNLLPELLIQRVDIVTGGASAAYGSDAVSGVVNYIIDNRFVGVRLNAQTGISTYGDDATIKLAAAAGFAFNDDRGHVVLSAEHFKQNGIDSLLDRPQSRRNAFLAGNGSAAAPFVTVEGALNNVATPGGVIIGPNNLPIVAASAPLAGTLFLPGGQVGAFGFGTPLAGSPNQTIGGSGYPNNLASPAAEVLADRIYARIRYDLTDHLTAWLRLNAGRSRTIQNFAAESRTAAAAYTIFRDNAFLPAQVANRMDTAGVGSFRFARFSRDYGPAVNDFTNKTFDIAGGIEGKLGDSWTWALSAGHGETVQNGRVRNIAILSNIYAQADAVRDPVSGQVVCRVTLTNPGLYPGCVPVNLFGEGSPSDAAKAFALSTSTQRVKNTQSVIDAQLQGDLLNLPGGALSVAIGAEYRERTLKEVSNSVALGQVQALGIRGFPTQICPTIATCRFGGFQQGNFGEADGNDNVKEAFTEIIAPILKDVPFFNELTVTAAYRYTDYEFSGGVSTWKAGISWSPIEDLRVRGTRSRDIRAPNLFELFAGPVNSFTPGITDAATGQTNVLVITRTQGNSNLLPEKADTWTLGAVYTPTWLPGLSGSVDYYDIDIGGALSTTAVQGTLDACRQGDTEACSRVTRDANNNIQQVLLQQINLNSRKVRGLDFDLSYTTDVGEGRLGLRALVNHALEYTDTIGIVQTRQAGFYNTANQLTIPKWRGNLSATYETGAFSLFVQERYIGGYVQMPFLPGQIFAEPKIKSVLYTDITARVRTEGLGAKFEFYGTVTNVFGKKPPLIGNRFSAALGYPTAPGLYDLDDRYFTVGVRAQF